MPSTKDTKTSRPSPRPGAERIVVDEVLDDETVRLLRAPYRGATGKQEYGIEAWGEERVEVMQAWRLEAFVGMRAPRHLEEGDVFFVRNGAKLTPQYDARGIARDRARRQHLLMDWEESTRLARDEIKREYGVLALLSSMSARLAEVTPAAGQLDHPGAWKKLQGDVRALVQRAVREQRKA